MSATQKVLVRSRTGERLPGVVEVDDDSLLVLTENVHGYKSAHRLAALTFFEGSVIRTDQLTWVNKHGVSVVLTIWRSK